MAVEAIIFDCFGVLVNDSWQEFYDTHFSKDPVKSADAYAYNLLVDKGEHSPSERVSYMANLAGISEEQLARERGARIYNDELLNYITAHLKGRFKIAILSNVGKGVQANVFQAWEQDIFDKVILSCDVGMAKPDHEIFEYTADVLGVVPDQCVYIDDREVNVAAARAVGMTALHYTDFRGLVRVLGEELYED